MHRHQKDQEISGGATVEAEQQHVALSSPIRHRAEPLGAPRNCLFSGTLRDAALSLKRIAPALNGAHPGAECHQSTILFNSLPGNRRALRNANNGGSGVDAAASEDAGLLRGRSDRVPAQGPLRRFGASPVNVGSWHAGVVFGQVAMDARSPPYLADSDNVGQRPEWGRRPLSRASRLIVSFRVEYRMRPSC